MRATQDHSGSSMRVTQDHSGSHMHFQRVQHREFSRQNQARASWLQVRLGIVRPQIIPLCDKMS